MNEQQRFDRLLLWNKLLRTIRSCETKKHIDTTWKFITLADGLLKSDEMLITIERFEAKKIEINYKLFADT
jgi:hypothetical protein